MLPKSLIRVAREALLPLAVLACFMVVAGFVPRRGGATPLVIALDEQPKAIDEDPHFHLLLQNSHVRVFTLGLPANSESFIRFEHNFLSIEPAEGEVIRWRDGESPIQHFRVHRGEIQFFLGDSVRGFHNDARTGEYRSLVVEFLDPGITTYSYRYNSGKWDYGPSLLSTPVDAAGHFVNSLDLNRAVASDVQLLPQELLPASDRVGLLVAISRVKLQMGKRQIQMEAGEVLWLDGREAELVNASNDAARFTLVELKTANEQY
jgi:hypothetical protein